MALFTLALVRDEMSRFLPSALRVWTSFSDELLVLDDNSSDGSREHAETFGARVFSRSPDAERAWGREASARSELFRLGWAEARIGDYLLILDADMTPATSPRALMETEASAIAFTLFDLWHEDDERRLFYRDDGAWKAHLLPRVWMVRKTTQRFDDFVWTNRRVHPGHLPVNLEMDTIVYAPTDHSLLHHAYLTPELREEKYVAYARVASELSDFEIAHARSILEPAPGLVSLPFQPELTLI